MASFAAIMRSGDLFAMKEALDAARVRAREDAQAGAGALGVQSTGEPTSDIVVLVAVWVVATVIEYVYAYESIYHPPAGSEPGAKTVADEIFVQNIARSFG